MKRSAIILALATIGTVGTPSHAMEELMCAANGMRYGQGETTCIRLSTGDYLARCEKVLNNSSWTKISDTCEDASGPELQEGSVHPPANAPRSLSDETSRTHASLRLAP